MKFSGIYKIQSEKKPERIYVGSAKNIRERWNEHKWALKSNKHYNKKLQNHYNKYGDIDLVYSVLLGCDLDNLAINEQFFLDALNPYFNICKGAYSCYGRILSEETRRKISQSHIGITQSPEVREKLRLNHIGVPHPHTPGQDQKIAESNRGKKRSDETRRKMSLAKVGYIPWNKGIHTGHAPWNKGKKGVQISFRKGKKLINGQYVKINGD